MTATTYHCVFWIGPSGAILAGWTGEDWSDHAPDWKWFPLAEAERLADTWAHHAFWSGTTEISAARAKKTRPR